MPTPAPTAKPTTARPTPKPTPMPTAWPTYAPVPAPPDPYCSRGFVSADNTVCCQAGCTRCSDTDCALLPPGVNNCCPATIAGNGRSCSLTDAPCNVQVPLPPPPATSDPYCVDGILDPKGTGAFCCARGCTLCGKSTCANDFYGAANCCGPNIVVANQSCNSHVAPCVVSLITNPPPVTAADKRRPVTIGVLPAPPLSLSQREAAYGMTFDSVLMYMKVGSVDYSQVVSYLNRGKHVDLVLEFQSTANLAAIMNGVYDSKLRSVGLANVADNKREINVRVMHEFNADWYPWGALNTANGGTTALFREAYKHVVTVLRLTGANFKYQLAYAMNNANNDLTPFKEFWVGDNYVDQICVSAYDGCGVFYATDRPLDDPNFRDFYYQVTAFSSRPVCIAEFSATSWCGTKPQWITESWASLANKYVKVNDINWFFENKSPPPRDWDLNYQNETDAFVNGYNAFKLITTPTQRLRELMRGNNSHKH
eukprot:TRINITY_DN8801_c0_g1_i1.p1 TRINITY_DN8801_c0_g1~~TRINITY_DN8801_c0_g1_i1.p1  ORF type:complete len:482 (-),score=166.60 TRINITY_DN8801_c0_g1_i1:956-2401(-)